MRQFSIRTFKSFFDPNSWNLHVRVMIEDLQMEGLKVLKGPHHIYIVYIPYIPSSFSDSTVPYNLKTGTGSNPRQPVRWCDLGLQVSTVRKKLHIQNVAATTLCFVKGLMADLVLELGARQWPANSTAFS